MLDIETLIELADFENTYEMRTGDGVLLPLEDWPMQRIFRGETLVNWEVDIRHVGRNWRRIFAFSGSRIIQQGQEPLALLFFSDITERTSSEKARQESENRFRQLFDCAPVPLCFVNHDGTVGSINQRFMQVLGYSLEDVPTLEHWWKLAFPDSTLRALATNEWNAALKRVKTPRTQGGKEILVACKSRELRTFLISVVRLDRGMIVSFTDATELRRMQAGAERESRRMALLANIAWQLLVSDSPTGCLGQICGDLTAELDIDKFTTYLPSTDGTHLVMKASSGLEPREREAITSLDCEHSLSGLVARQQEPLVLNDLQHSTLPEAQTIIPHGIKAYAGFPLLSPGGKNVGVMGYASTTRAVIAEDDLRLMKAVAGQVAAALERSHLLTGLREGEERFRQVVENIQEVFWIADLPELEMRYVSPACLRLWGLPPQELMTRDRWFATIHPEDRERMKSTFDRQLQGVGCEESYRIVRPDGEVRWIDDRTFPIRDASGRVYRIVGTAVDVTTHHLLEEQVRQSQKMEAIGTLAGGIAHDFNNILGAISGHTELLRLDLHDPQSIASIEEILRACRRASDLVKQILAFSRQRDQRREPIQLKPVIEESSRLLRAAVPSTIEFHVNLDTPVPTVLADTVQIQQVVMNLCTNAVQAMSGRNSGRLGISLDRFEAAGDFVRTHPEARAGTYARLTVSDTGEGMSPATLGRIFDPFFTTKAPGQGSGLGLSVVHGIVHNHEGLITVDSAPGKGTTFQVLLPAHDTATMETTSTPLCGDGESVLVIDDEQPLAQMLGKILQRLGYVAHVTTDAGSAIETLEQAPDRYHLVITDQTMPQLTGLELAVHIAARFPDIPIILMTGFAEGLSKEEVKAAGIRDVLKKPITMKALGESIARVLQSTP